MVTTYMRAVSEGFNVSIDPVTARRQLRLSLALVALLVTATAGTFAVSGVSTRSAGIDQPQRVVQLPERVKVMQASGRSSLVGG